jgi:hypothetical protein
MYKTSVPWLVVESVVVVAFFVAWPATAVFAHSGEIVVAPKTVAQGEPARVTVRGVDIRDIRKLTFDGKTVPVFLFEGRPTALIGVDLAARAGTHKLRLAALDGDAVMGSVSVVSRKKISAPLGIPQKLGGNTKQSQQNLVANLAKENGVLAKVQTSAAPFWNAPFAYPLEEATITDAYGYSRATGSYSIPHKGADFRAATGTPVVAINDGVVRLAREFVVYGKTVAIDHGGGVVSLSMHLASIGVKEGQKVKRGERVGLSGESGYALSPHLHLSVRIHGVSIDPMKFFALFGIPETTFLPEFPREAGPSYGGAGRN